MTVTQPLFQRLPQTIVPLHYDLTIKPNLEKFTFDGNIVIDLIVNETVNVIELYGADIEIQNAQIKTKSGTQACTVEFDKEAERIKVQCSRNIEKGDYQLSLKFAGEINNKMKGFYRTKYKTPEGETSYGASTQFQASDCRRAFPCWDEPAFKATFDITMVIPKQLLAISNMPVKSESDYYSDDDRQWKVTKFDRTPIMSTYLVAFIVGDYDFVETKDSNGVILKVYTPLGKKEHGKFALEAGSKILPFYADYFGIKYPLKKLDMIGSPGFSVGGMENWGLIIYNETALLIDPKFSSMDNRQTVAWVVAHELAHQWFGNLVTMDWWTDLWLNEGFATWIQFLAVDKFFPEFDFWTQFVAHTFARFLVPDALQSSHPVEVPIGHPAEIDEIFDDISYSKGASVVRMLHDYIGDDAFRKGLHNYLEEYSYKNTVTENLWTHLANISNKPVSDVMGGWTLQMGYPLLTVHEQQSGNQRIVTLKQQRFIADGSKDKENLQWQIPVTFVSKSQPNKVLKQVLMDKPEICVTLDNVKEDDWIKLNLNSIGLYRIKYEQKTLERLGDPISTKKITPQCRLMIQNDLAALCFAGHQSFIDYLKLLLAYKDEDNFTVWKSIASNIGDISSLLEYTNYFEEMKKYCLHIFSTIQKKLGWDPKSDEDPLSAILRPLILGIVGKSGDQAIIDEARKRFDRHLSGDQIDPNIRSAVYVLVSRFGDESTQDKLRKLYLSAETAEEKVRLLRSMGQTHNPELIKKTLRFILETDDVRIQDSYIGLAGCTTNRVGRELVWHYLRENWKKLAEKFGEKSRFLIFFVNVLSDFADQKTSTEIKKFFDSTNTPIVTRPVNRIVEKIHMRAQALKRDSKAIEDYFICRSKVV